MIQVEDGWVKSKMLSQVQSVDEKASYKLNDGDLRILVTTAQQQQPTEVATHCFVLLL